MKRLLCLLIRMFDGPSLHNGRKFNENAASAINATHMERPSTSRKVSIPAEANSTFIKSTLHRPTADLSDATCAVPSSWQQN
jgi:hypothetical protein